MSQSTEHGVDTLLARAAAFGTTSQDVRAATPEVALGFVIDAIRTCVLPRDLTILADGGPRLRLIASGGQLLELLPGRGVESHPAAAGLLDRPLDGTSPADLDALADLLLGLFPGGERLGVTTATLSATPDPMVSGIACPALQARLNLRPFDAAVPDPLDYVIAAAEEVLLAVLRPGTDIALQTAEADLPDGLVDQARALLDRPDGVLSLLDKDGLLCLQPADAEPLALILAQGGAGPVALIVHADAMADLAALWAGMRHGMVLCAR